MTQHDTSVKLSKMICNDPAKLLVYVKMAFAAGYDKGRNLNNESEPVIQLTMNGQYIDVFNSMSQADNELDISNASIGEAAKGRRKQAGGYKWRFVNDE